MAFYVYEAINLLISENYNIRKQMEIVGLDSIFNSCYFCCFNLYV